MKDILGWIIVIWIGLSPVFGDDHYSNMDWTMLAHSIASNGDVSSLIKKKMVKSSSYTIHPKRPLQYKQISGLDPQRERVRRYACVIGIPVPLALAVAEQETGFQSIVGQDGEKGVFQVMPATADWNDIDRNRLLDFDYGIYAGIYILKDLLEKFPEQIAIAAYNAGPGYNRMNYPLKVQQKIYEYVTLVLRRKMNYARYSCTK